MTGICAYDTYEDVYVTLTFISSQSAQANILLWMSGLDDLTKQPTTTPTITITSTTTTIKTMMTTHFIKQMNLKVSDNYTLISEQIYAYILTMLWNMTVSGPHIHFLLIVCPSHQL